MKNPIPTATKAFKQITLADIYEKIDKGEQRQEEDFRYLNQRMDSLGQRLDTRVDALDKKIDALSQRVDAMSNQMNQRFDTIMQMLVDILKKN